MNNVVSSFTFASDKEVRVLAMDDELWFVGEDVCELLGYKKPEKSLSTWVIDEDKKIWRLQTPQGLKDMIIINERGLNSLFLDMTVARWPMKMRKRLACTFIALGWKSQVQKEIDMNSDKEQEDKYTITELINNPDLAIKLFTALKEKQEKENKKYE